MRSTRTNKTSNTDHNLAGPPSRPHLPRTDRTDIHNTYYAQGYRALNPLMENTEPRPSFSLARTFPHQVRWGAGKKAGNPKTVEQTERGETQTAPWDREGEVEQATNEEVEWDGGDEAVESEASTQVDRLSQAGRDVEEGENDDTPEVQHRRVDAFRKDGEWAGNVAEEHTVEGDAEDQPFNHWALLRLRFQRPLAEWLGTTIYSFIGISGTLAVQTSSPSSPLTPQSQYWTWGFATMLAIYVSGGGSGAFLNPALTILLSVFRGFPARRVPTYILAQILGCFTGALLAFAVYRDGILVLSEDGILSAETTGTAFYTQPKEWMGNGSAFLTELLGTAVVGISILALGDSGNSPPGAGMHAFVIGLLITTVTMALGQGTGGCFNPARDLGPRIATVVLGYDSGMWSARDWWWIWGAWGATVTGALLGGFVYDACIFKGGESPVNYSRRRWKVEGLKEEKVWTERLGMRKKTKDLQKKLEEGAVEKE
ncbi:aquaporin-like protein [Zymoseptoria brevis]|uniref:Aquaporin-like protein n=1 Tax=Zymoseptoria brevis TaxID=1047168 RepID=A0A0F4GN10_9PEZI|nr:aquaporin-like protein [Zymoseptoria brevis]